MIDHSILKPEFTTQDVIDGCKLAREYDVASVCVRPCDVSTARDILAGSSVAVSTVIGFPHGTTTTHTKVCSYEGRVHDERKYATLGCRSLNPSKQSKMAQLS